MQLSKANQPPEVKLTKLERFMHNNPDMEFAQMSRQLNRTLTAIENTYDRLQKKRRFAESIGGKLV